MDFMKSVPNKNIIKGRVVLSADGTVIAAPAIITETTLLKDLKAQLQEATTTLVSDKNSLASVQASRGDCFVPKGPLRIKVWDNSCLNENTAQTNLYAAKVDAGTTRVNLLTSQIAEEQKSIQTTNAAVQKAYEAQAAAQLATQNFQTANNPIAQKQKADADAVALDLKAKADLALANLNAQTSLAASQIASKKYIIIGSISAAVIIIVAVVIYIIKSKKGA